MDLKQKIQEKITFASETLNFYYNIIDKTIDLVIKDTLDGKKESCETIRFEKINPTNNNQTTIKKISSKEQWGYDENIYIIETYLQTLLKKHKYSVIFNSIKKGPEEIEITSDINGINRLKKVIEEEIKKEDLINDNLEKTNIENNLKKLKKQFSQK